jgi:hypothetical protein
MEKITLKALQLAGFQNADMIAEIISYVPNPRVATEMLLGIHEPMSLNPADRFRTYRYHRDNLAEIISIDELGDTITYKEYEQKTMQVWYLTEEDWNNKKYVTDRPKSYHDYNNIPANGIKETERTTSLTSFNENWSKNVSVDDALAKLYDWEQYGVPQYSLENELPF